jgi:hypothetical protein
MADKTFGGRFFAVFILFNVANNASLVHGLFKGDGAVGIMAAFALGCRTRGERITLFVVTGDTGDSVSFNMRLMVKRDGKVTVRRFGRVLNGNYIGPKLDGICGNANKSEKEDERCS